MPDATVTRDLVIDKASELPGFPRVISEILATIDDPDANLNVLSQLIKLDPVIAARVLALANSAAAHTHPRAAVRDIYAATSLIGMGRVRQMTLISSCLDYFGKIGPANLGATFWQHSVAVGICGEEVALHIDKPVPASQALIAGLLHDIGQLWLYNFRAGSFRSAWNQALSSNCGIEVAEAERFGVAHPTIGAWLAEYWSLPPAIIKAIRHHHDGDADLDETLVPTIHVAEVLANALDLGERKENRVMRISAAACHSLGLVWDEDVRNLFGRIDARSRHANAFFA